MSLYEDQQRIKSEKLKKEQFAELKLKRVAIKSRLKNGLRKIAKEEFDLLEPRDRIHWHRAGVKIQ